MACKDDSNGDLLLKESEDKVGDSYIPTAGSDNEYETADSDTDDNRDSLSNDLHTQNILHQTPNNNTHSEGNCLDASTQDKTNEDASDTNNSDTDPSDIENREENNKKVENEEKSRRACEDEMTEEEREKLQRESQELKKQGNSFFNEQHFTDASNIYTKALLVCPICYTKDRAIMYSNRAACKVKLEKHDSAIEDSCKAIELNPQYVKALLRRAELYEKTDKLDEALGDYQKILELDASLHSVRAACLRLPDQINERNEKLKNEMFGKLKELGNMVLKPFGLSTENFKIQQDPSTGSYSINMQNSSK